MKKENVLLILVSILGFLSFFIDNFIINIIKGIGFGKVFLYAFQPFFVMGMFIILMILITWYNKKKYVLPIAYSIVFTGIVCFILKAIIQRPRPFGLIEMFPLISMIDYSFPSLHTALMFAMVPILNKEFPRFRFLWIFIALLIGFSRLYLGFHYLSDVLFGGLIGYLIGFYYINKLTNKKNK